MATGTRTSAEHCPTCGWERKGRKICANCATVFYDDEGPAAPPVAAGYIPAIFWSMVIAAALVMVGPTVLFSSEPDATRGAGHRRGGSSVGVMAVGVLAGGAILAAAFKYRRSRDQQ